MLQGTPTKQKLQIEVGNEIVMHSLLSLISSLDFKPLSVPIDTSRICFNRHEQRHKIKAGYDNRKCIIKQIREGSFYKLNINLQNIWRSPTFRTDNYRNDIHKLDKLNRQLVFISCDSLDPVKILNSYLELGHQVRSEHAIMHAEWQCQWPSQPTARVPVSALK